MRTSLAIVLRVIVIVMITLIATGCAAASAPLSPTLPPTSIPTAEPSPTPCMGGYTWAYGSVPPEFITQVQEAMTASGQEGTVEASTFGENNGCGEYLAQAVDYTFRVHVESLEESADLATRASIILDIAQRFVPASPAPNLGRLQLMFQAKGQQCGWFYEAGAWNAGAPTAENLVSCPVPVSDESQRLASALTGLSIDLTCETSRVTATTRQAVLECERPEGVDRYIVIVTLRLNGTGYEETCFHGYKAFESFPTGDTPMTVTENGNTYYERDRTFQWTAHGVLYELFERIKGGSDVTLPGDTHEKVYLRALQEGLIPGEGGECR